MNTKHAFLALSVFTLVSFAYGERELFAPSKLAPVAEAGTIQFGDGSAVAPSMTFSADNNTGIYRPTTDTIGFATNGNIRAAIDGYNMCVGNDVLSSSPQSGNISATSGSGTNIGGANLTLRAGNSTGTGAGGYLAFQTAAAGSSGSSLNTLTERMRITSAGDIIAGNGDRSATPAAATIRGTDGSGTNIAGATVTIQGGRSTGSASGGTIAFATSSNSGSGSGLNSAADRVRIKGNGALRFMPRTTPGSPEEGDVYFDSGTKKLRVYDGIAWVDLH